MRRIYNTFVSRFSLTVSGTCWFNLYDLQNMHGDKIAGAYCSTKEAMRQARKEIEEAEDEHHE